MLERVERDFGLRRRRAQWDLGGCVWRFGTCQSPDSGPEAYAKAQY